MTNRPLSPLRRPLVSGPPKLTALELRCLTLASEGKTPGEMVLATDVPMTRISEALSSAMEKLDVRNITGAVTRAARFKLI